MCRNSSPHLTYLCVALLLLGGGYYDAVQRAGILTDCVSMNTSVPQLPIHMESPVGDYDVLHRKT